MLYSSPSCGELRSTAGQAKAYPTEAEPMRRRTLLIGWDAADWKLLNPLIERGEMPVFGQLIERGVLADNITLEPILSPMLWNSIGTGKRADRHGILGFTEVDPETGRVRPVSSTSRRCKALWNILSQNGRRTNVVGC